MKTILKIILAFFALLVVISIYANTLHPLFFLKDNEPVVYNQKKLNESIAVEFKSGDVTLRGHIITKAPKGTKVPVIIFATGSGEGSYATNYTEFVKYFFEDNFDLENLAIFYFDKRGVGSSEGNWFKANFYQRAEDVKAAAEFASELDFIDKDKIMVIGHSQGGWIAQLCMAQYPDLFYKGVSLAGPTFGIKQQFAIELASELQCNKNLSQKEAVARAIKKERFIATVMKFYPFAKGWVQYNYIRDYEAATHLPNIKKPFLFVFAENDALVYRERAISELDGLYNDLPENLKVEVIEHATHEFRTGALCDHYLYKPTPYREDLKRILKNWVK